MARALALLMAAGACIAAPVAEAARNLEILVAEAGSPVVGADVCLGLQENDAGEGYGTSDATGTVRFANRPAGSRTYYATVTRPGVTGAIRSFQITNNLNGALDPPQQESVMLPGTRDDATCAPPVEPPTPGTRLPLATLRQWMFESCLRSFCLTCDILGSDFAKRWRERLPANIRAFCEAAAGRVNHPGAAIAAFNGTVPVFRHPRCTTCHSPTTVPASPHPTQVAGHAIGPADCATCHNRTMRPASGATAPVPLQNSNRAWQMAPASMALTPTMTARDICLQIKSQVSGATDAERADHVADHVLEDDLVRWAFAPECGVGQTGTGACDPATRPPAPGGHQAFADALRDWANSGGGCP